MRSHCISVPALGQGDSNAMASGWFYLPNVDALVFRNEQGVFLRDVECLIPSIDMRQRTVDTPASWGVWVDFVELTEHGFADVSTPNQGVAQEEALLGRKAVFCAKRVFFRGVLECLESDVQTAVVCDVLAQGEFAVCM